ncbi:MAG: TolC family protein [Nitrospirota bacterium]|jgi:outer membrane protein
MRRLRVALSLVLVLAFTGGAHALTVDEAVKTALQNNHRIQQFIVRERSVQETIGSRRSEFMPRLDANYNYRKSSESTFFQAGTTSLVALEASYNLFRGFSDLRSYQAARKNAEAAVYERRAVQEDIVLSVRTAYAEVLRARSRLQTAKESVRLLERQLKDAAAFLREGLIAKNDYLKVEVELATARQNLLQARGNVRVTLKRLARLMAVEIAEDEEIEGFAGLPALDVGAYEGMKKAMLERRSELKALRAQRESETLRMRAIKGQYYPSLDVSASYTRYGDSVVPNGHHLFFGDEMLGTVSLNWNLFSGFRRKHDMAEARYLARATEQEYRDTVQELTLQLREAVELYSVSEGQLKVARTAVVQAEENYRVTDARYRENLATTTDLIDAENFLTRARNQLDGALYDLHIAAARIQRVLEQGVPEEFRSP